MQLLEKKSDRSKFYIAQQYNYHNQYLQTFATIGIIGVSLLTFLLFFPIKNFFLTKNLKNINCFSNEGNQWRDSLMKFEENVLKINFREKFLFRRGRVNCSLNDDKGWRWFGIQFTIEQLK